MEEYHYCSLKLVPVGEVSIDIDCQVRLLLIRIFLILVIRLGVVGVTSRERYHNCSEHCCKGH